MNESRRAARFLLLLLLAAGCRGIDLPAPASEPAQVVPREPAAAPEPAQDPLETIARFEEARSDGGGLVELLLVRGEPQTRERAALALGRLPPGQGGSAVRDALAGALDDPEPSVRAAAAFGIGLRAEPASADALIAHARDRDARVRARVVEAASRVDDPRMVGLVLGALRDLDPAVRAEAALAPHRWTGDRAKSGGDAAAVDKALIDLFQPRVDSSVLEENVVLRAASFSLARRKSQAAAENHFPGVILDSSDPLVQIYGCQALAGVSAPLALPELRKALADRDWRVRCEAAIALGKHPAAESVEPLERALADRSAHVRRVACEALGGFGEHREAALAALAHAGQDSSANVRAAALIARARLDPRVGLAGDRVGVPID